MPTIFATIDIDPDTLNLKSNGEWITCYIELPNGYDVNNIDVGSITLTVEGGDFYVDTGTPTTTADYDYDGIPDLMVKFARAAIRDHLNAIDYNEDSGIGEQVEFVVTSLVDSTQFKGSDMVRVISPGK